MAGTPPSALVEAVVRRGYRASLSQSASSHEIASRHDQEAAILGRLFLLCAAFTVPVFFISMVLPMLPYPQV
jgi:hypothetical protein